MDYIDENFRRKLLLGEIARREGLTMPYLSHLFKDTLGMSFQEYLKKRRFEYARSLLLGTRKSLLDISLESGFSDARYMIRMFEGEFGCTPKEYRRKNGPVQASQSAGQGDVQNILDPQAALRLLDGRGACLAHSCGEALFAPDGVSGIAAMQLARWWQPGCSLRMDLREAVLGPRAADHEEALAETARLLRVRAQHREGCRLIELLTGAAPPALNEALLRAAGLERHAASPLADLAALLPNAFAALAQAIVDFRVPITGTRGFDAAQVTAGGVMTDGFDPRTLQSRLCPGLHAAGEVLDVDGACGGFNLMFATASGLLAGGAK